MYRSGVKCAVALAAFVISCAAADPTAARAFEKVLQGKVTNRGGKPIPDCYVTISGSSYEELGHTRTDAQGRYSVTVPEAEQYHVWACKGDGQFFHHIPETRSTQGQPTDFSLQPGANIVIVAYDEHGRRIKNGAFRGSASRRVYLTDMSEMPAEGYFGAVHNPGSDWQWESADPAAIVQPGKSYKIFVRWEFAGIGDLLYALDNQGNGYRLPAAGQALEINFNEEVARTALANLRRHPRVDSVSDAVARSEADLRRGEAVLGLAEPDMAAAVRFFRQSLQISLAAQEDAELALARDNIEKHRKGEIAVRFVGEDGSPVRGAHVSYRQISRDFAFGAHPLGLRGTYDERLARLMKQAGINQSYVTVRWGQLESVPGRYDWHNMDLFQSLDAQHSAGFELLGALSLWFSPNNDFSPAHLRGAEFSRLRSRVYAFGNRLGGRYGSRIATWEVNELNLASANALKLTWQQRLQVGQEFVRGLKSAAPHAAVMVGSTALPFEFADSRPLCDVLRSGVTADKVGLEFYYAGVNQDGDAVPGLDIPTISRTLDHYDEFGKPIYVKEFSVPSRQVEGSSWWKRPWDQDLQAEFATKFYTVAFSKPLVRGIAWSWGVADPDAFIISGGLLDKQLEPKKAYFALAGLLDSWNSKGAADAGPDGSLNIRGFAGDYEIVATDQNGRRVSTTVHISEQVRKQATITIPSARWVESERGLGMSATPDQPPRL